MSDLAVDAVALLVATQFDRSTTLRQALAAAGWRVVAPEDPQDALAALRAGGLSAVFCDEYLRGASPAGFLAWSRRLSPELPFYLFAADPDASVRGPHQPTGVLAFPPAPGRLPRPQGGGGPGFGASGDEGVPLAGELEQTPLAGLLDMMAIAAQSAVVLVAGDVDGELVLERGVLQHASVGGEASGVRAVAELIGARSGSFRVEPYRAPARRTLNLPVAVALTEAAKLVDELARDRELVARVRTALPTARAIAAGYPLGRSALVGEGDAREAFEAATRLLAANRAELGRVSHLCAEGDAGAVALVVYGEGRLLAATAARGQSLKLLAALAAAVRGPAAGA